MALTLLLYFRSGSICEGSPMAEYIWRHFGISGLVAFKVWALVVTCAAIKALPGHIGRRLLDFGCGALAVTLLESVFALGLK